MVSEFLSPNQQAFAETCTRLNLQEKILLVTVLLYCSTQEGRTTYGKDMKEADDPVRLMGLNELQHRISDHLLHLVTNYQKRRSDADFLSLVLHLCQRYKVSLRMVLEKFDWWNCAEKHRGQGSGEAP